jgi:pilus assembly protein FimV
MVSIFQKGNVSGGVLLLLVSLLATTRLLAQGLGELELQSNLNEPLRARIALLDVSNYDTTQIQVSLATPEEFEAAQLERSPALESVTFEVVAAPAGGLQVNLTSTATVEEPYLTFLVNALWPGGRGLREYTVLFNLPNQTIAEPAPTVSTTTNTPAVAPPTSTRDLASTSTSTTLAANASAAEYVVKAGDTAYQIAAKNRPSNDVSVQQMMLAIQRANEDAFVNNNINRILTGKVLRIPSIDEVRVIEQDAAVAQISQQTQALGNQPLAANNATAGGAAASRDELTILNGTANGGGAGSNDLAGTIASLENELMLSEEGVDRARLENLELTNRFTSLQEQIELLQNIIAVEDERIAQLQAQLSKQAVEAPVASETEQASDEPAPEAASGLAGMLRTSVMVLLGVLVVSIGFVVALLVRRRNAARAQAEEAAMPLVESAAPAAAVASFAADDTDVESEKLSFVDKVKAVVERLFKRADAKLVKEEPALQEDFVAPIAASVVVEELLVEPAPAVAEVDSAMIEAVVDPEQNTEAMVDAAFALSEEERQEPDFAEVDLSTAPTAEVVSAVEVVAESVEEVSPIIEMPELLLAEPEVIDSTVEEMGQIEEELEINPEVFEFSLPEIEDVPRDLASDNSDENPVDSASPTDEVPESFAFTLDEVEDEVETKQDAIDPELELRFDDSALSFEDSALSFDEEGADDEDGLPSQDTQDARLDLAVAYEAMGDIDGAVEILDEVIANGKPQQVEEAQSLKLKWQNS